MQTHFGIIAGLCFTLAGCDSGGQGLILTDSNQALGCRGHAATCSAQDADAEEARDGERTGHHDAGAASTPASDAGDDACRERGDSGRGCERHADERSCEGEHDNRGPGSGDDEDEDEDDHGGHDDDALADAGSAKPCKDDRSGSSSGPH